MSKFTFTRNGGFAYGCEPLQDVKRVGSTRLLGSVAKTDRGDWVAFAPNREPDFGYRTRQAAAERLLLVSSVNPVVWSALPADPFEGVSA